MFYLGIDQHRKQLTISLRDEQGSVVLRQQVSTNWDRVREFFARLRERCAADGGFVAIVEVCGFNDWLLKLLVEYGCKEIVLVQPETRSKKKTDRRDANRLSELLWVNRQRLLAGEKVQGLRRVWIAPAEVRQDRQLAELRKRLAAQRTRVINHVSHILRKHNLQQGCPTKGIKTKMARGWLKTLALPELDRFELDQALEQWELLDRHLAQTEKRIADRVAHHPQAQRIASIYGSGGYSGLAIAASVGEIERFPQARSLANYWGITPSCRNSGEATGRLGSITKQGSATVRFLLGQIVTQVLRRDTWMQQWYKRIKHRRGSKIARVAVMRRLATIIWHMLKHKQPYLPGDPAKWKKLPSASRGGGAEGAAA
jgi:transposase